MDQHVFQLVRPLATVLEKGLQRSVMGNKNISPQLTDLLHRFGGCELVDHGNMLTNIIHVVRESHINMGGEVFHRRGSSNEHNTLGLDAIRRLLISCTSYPRCCAPQRHVLEEMCVEKLISSPSADLCSEDLNRLWAIAAACTEWRSVEAILHRFPLETTLNLQSEHEFRAILLAVMNSRHRSPTTAATDPAGEVMIHRHGLLQRLGTNHCWQRMTTLMFGSHSDFGGRSTPKSLSLYLSLSSMIEPPPWCCGRETPPPMEMSALLASIKDVPSIFCPSWLVIGEQVLGLERHLHHGSVAVQMYDATRTLLLKGMWDCLVNSAQDRQPMFFLQYLPRLAGEQTPTTPIYLAIPSEVPEPELLPCLVAYYKDMMKLHFNEYVCRGLSMDVLRSAWVASCVMLGGRLSACAAEDGDLHLTMLATRISAIMTKEQGACAARGCAAPTPLLHIGYMLAAMERLGCCPNEGDPAAFSCSLGAWSSTCQAAVKELLGCCAAKLSPTALMELSCPRLVWLLLTQAPRICQELQLEGVCWELVKSNALNGFHQWQLQELQTAAVKQKELSPIIHGAIAQLPDRS